MKVLIRDIVFRNASLLSAEDRRKISKATRDEAGRKTAGSNSGEDLGASEEAAASLASAVAHEADTVAEEASERVRVTYQNQGYFKVEVDSKAVRVSEDVARYDILVRVLREGRQYRLGDLNMVRTTVFPEPQLRDLFPIQRGEIFSREKIAKGLQELRTLYSSQGYINFTAVPETEFEEDRAIINLQVDTDEGRQFRLRNVEILDLDPETEARVLNNFDMKAGDIFAPEPWGRSFLKFVGAAEFPQLTTVRKTLDEREGQVDVVLDFKKPDPCLLDLSVVEAIPLRRASPQE